MLSVARLVCACALLCATCARVFDRCELARELLRVGVSRLHLATWVCIAYHESRFDTAAMNPHSGDHGLLQISELYWCGGGKVCAPSCAQFRDDDITDDVACAHVIHDEHTRLQGDGFLAWVVYPQHCKHNTKKYLADCDLTLKLRSERTRSLNATSENHPKIDELKPPYLIVNSIVRERTNSHFQFGDQSINWLEYKIDNIDELKLPVFKPPPTAISSTPAPPAAPLATSTQGPPTGFNKITDDEVKKVTPADKQVYDNSPKLDYKYSSLKSTSDETSTRATTTFKTTTPATATTLRQYKEFKFRNQYPKVNLPTTRFPKIFFSKTNAQIDDKYHSRDITTTPPTASNSNHQDTSYEKLPSYVFTKTTTKPPRMPRVFNFTRSDHRISLNYLPSTQKPISTTRKPETTTELDIFEFYLNRRKTTRAPFSFAPFIGRGVKIFSGGTTAAPAHGSWSSQRDAKAPQGGARRNHFRRQIET